MSVNYVQGAKKKSKSGLVREGVTAQICNSGFYMRESERVPLFFFKFGFFHSNFSFALLQIWFSE